MMGEKNDGEEEHVILINIQNPYYNGAYCLFVCQLLPHSSRSTIL